jgi:membrane-associated phospholipid phosphatase
MNMKLVQAVFTFVSAAPGLAQSPAPAPKLFIRNDAYWAAGFFLGSVALSTADVRITRAWTSESAHDSTRDRLARNFARIQEGTLTVGNLVLYGVGRLTKSRALADVTFHAAEAVVAGSVAAQLIRGPLGRSRPHVTNYTDQYDFKPFRGFSEFDYRAFPSIHTASAFAVATVYTLETQRRAPGATWIVGPIAYAIAAGPGLARLYNGQHWASDIFAGAFLGAFAGVKIVRYNHDVKPDNRINKFFLGAKNVQLGIGTQSFSATYARTF